MFRKTQGAAYVEFVLFLSIIVAVILSTMAVVQTASQDLLTDANRAIFNKHRADVGSDAQERSGSIVRANDRTTRVRSADVWRLFVLAGIAVAACGVWARYSHQQSQRLAERKDVDEQVDEVPELNHDLVFAKRQEIFRMLSGDMNTLFQSRMEVRHLMSRRTQSVAPHATTDEVRNMMRENRLRHLLVCDDEDRLLGIISDRDLQKQGPTTAAALMTTDPITVASNSLVCPAVTQLIKNRISCLPVVEDGKVCGVLTTTDLMMALQCALQMMKKLANEVVSANGENATTDNPDLLVAAGVSGNE